MPAATTTAASTPANRDTVRLICMAPLLASRDALTHRKVPMRYRKDAERSQPVYRGHRFTAANAPGKPVALRVAVAHPWWHVPVGRHADPSPASPGDPLGEGRRPVRVSASSGLRGVFRTMTKQAYVRTKPHLNI